MCAHVCVYMYVCMYVRNVCCVCFVACVDVCVHVHVYMCVCTSHVTKRGVKAYRHSH